MTAFAMGEKVAAAVKTERRAMSVADFVARARTFRNPMDDIPADERARAHAEFAEIGEISGRGVKRSILNYIPL